MKKEIWRPFLAGLFLRVALPWYGHGFRYMDEHWQVIEPASHLARGPWSVTVEWREGLRSWIYPWLISLPMRAAESLGLNDPLWIAALVRAVQGALAALAIPLMYLTVKKLVPDRQRIYAYAAAWFVALWPFAIYCSFHTQGDMIGALFVLAGVAAPALIESEARGYLLAGLSFGAALALKIDLAVAGLGFGLWQLLHGRLRRAAFLVAGVAPLVVLVGLVDRLTWGTWFHSVLAHARVNLVEHVGDQWGVSPWYTHVLYFFDITSVPALLGLVALPLCWRKVPELIRATWFMNALFVGVFCTIPHKEKRFIAPLLYSGPLAGFATLAYARSRVGTRAARTIALVATLALAVHAGINVVTYLVRRPWWDRLSAMHEAGHIPGIEKMFAPQWPAIFYLPRNVPSEAIDADDATVAAKTKGLKRIGVAADWKVPTPFEHAGFHCEKWPNAAPESSSDPVPQAFLCVRQ